MLFNNYEIRPWVYEARLQNLNKEYKTFFALFVNGKNVADFFLSPEETKEFYNKHFK